MAFDVASAKPNKSDGPTNSRFSMGPGDAYVPDGGVFSASNQPLIVYLRFASSSVRVSCLIYRPGSTTIGLTLKRARREILRKINAIDDAVPTGRSFQADEAH